LKAKLRYSSNEFLLSVQKTEALLRAVLALMDQLAKVVKELALYAKLASGQTKTKLNVCVVLMALSIMSWVAHAPNVLQTQSQMKVKPVVKL
jgi:hypothetical protein